MCLGLKIAGMIGRGLKVFRRHECVLLVLCMILVCVCAFAVRLGLDQSDETCAVSQVDSIFKMLTLI